MHFGENRRAEAISLLAPHSSENEHISQLLEAIESGDFRRIDEELANEGDSGADIAEESDPSGLGPLQTWRQDALGGYVVDDIISRNAAFRKLKFEVEYGTRTSSEYALRLIQEAAPAPGEEYVTFVQTLFADIEISEYSTGSLAAELVRAFEGRRIKELDLIASEIPRLGVVVCFAKAGLGQADSLSEIDAIRDGSDEMVPWERRLVASISDSRFGKGILRISGKERPVDTTKEMVKRMGDLVGAVVTLESLELLAA